MSYLLGVIRMPLYHRVGHNTLKVSHGDNPLASQEVLNLEAQTPKLLSLKNLPRRPAAHC